MNHNEHTVKNLSLATGLSATLRAFFPSRGTGAPSVGVVSESSRACWLTLPVLAVCMTTLCLLFAAPVFAGQARIFTGSFGGAASTVVDPYPLHEGPGESIPGLSVYQPGDAVDESTGDVYVTDPFNRRVEKFSASGEFILMFGKEVNKTKVDAKTATDEAEENICTEAEVVLGAECQQGTAGSTPGAFESSEILYVAVDNSPGPSRGDVYVADSSIAFDVTGHPGDDRVSKFDSSGNLIVGWGGAGQLDGSTATDGPFSKLRGIAVDPLGNLWVYGSTTEEVSGQRLFARARVYEFNQEAAFTADWSTHVNESPGFGIAVDSAEDVYLVLEGGFVYKYDAAGVPFAGQIADQDEVRASALAVDSSSDLYVGYPASTEQAGTDYLVARYETSCQPRPFGGGCVPAESFSSKRPDSISGIAVNPSSSGHTNTIYAVENVATEVSGFSVETVPDVLTGRASDFAAGSTTLNGTVNPAGEPVTECFFEYGETESYGQQAPCEEVAGSGSNPVEVHAKITGLQSGKAYHFRLVAANANDVNSIVDEPSRGHDLSFGPPLISGSSADVASTSATLEAEVDPENVDTLARIEYGTDAGYGHTTSEVEAGHGTAEETFSFHLQGLAPDTTYHYRVIATSALSPPGGSTSADLTFTTQPVGGGTALPDGRQWELVTPPNKRGAEVISLSGANSGLLSGDPGPIQAAEAGGAFTYQVNTPTEAEPPGYGFQGVNQALSARGAEGWSTRDIATPNTAATHLTISSEYLLFSADLSSALADPEIFREVGGVRFREVGDGLLSSEASEWTPYLRREALCDVPASTNECFTPLVTGKEGFADVPPNTHFVLNSEQRPQALGASPDLRHVTLESDVALTTTPIPPSSGLQLQNEVYEWSAGAPASEALRLVSVLPADEGGGPVAGGQAIVGQQDTHKEHSSGARHSLSDDGSRVFWRIGTSEHRGGGLYMRYNATQPQSPVNESGECTVSGDACTLRLDVPEPGCVEPECGNRSPQAAEALFQVASSDGSRVFFTDGQKLTRDSGAERREEERDARDLYECAIVDEGGKPACKLRDLTPKRAGRSAEAQEMVSAASEDGSDVYFVANGVLTEEKNARGESASPGGCAYEQQAAIQLSSVTCNLYEDHDGAVKFIAKLSRDDDADWGNAQEGLMSVNGLATYASPDGRYLTFMSDRSLTGYDNRDVISGKPDEEVYLYDGLTGHLACASCNPSGARPSGIAGTEFFPGSEEGGGGVHSGNLASVIRNHTASTDWFAANLPGGERIGNHGAFYQPRPLSDGGRVFFNSSDALAPQDVNGNVDVYEFEPEGTGSCEASSTSFNSKTGGCVSLISSGTSPEESGFMDASENGSDVFLLTTSRLTSQDYDAAFDIYDAHECAPASPCIAPPAPSSPPCDSEASCKAAPTPQPEVFGTPASGTFSGPGNLMQSPVVVKPKTKAKPTKCKKGFVKKKNRCVSKRKLKRSKKTNRRASR